MNNPPAARHAPETQEGSDAMAPPVATQMRCSGTVSAPCSVQEGPPYEQLPQNWRRKGVATRSTARTAWISSLAAMTPQTLQVLLMVGLPRQSERVASIVAIGDRGQREVTCRAVPFRLPSRQR